MGSVFLSPNQANSLLKRFPRANSLLEELKQGDIQRECREETCTYEEAREAFENDEKTKRFWEEYVRESNSGSGIEMGGSLFHSVYLIVPLLAGLLLIIIVLVALWRCHSRKLFQRGSTFSQRREAAGRRDRHLSLVGMDQRGHSSYHPDISPQSDLSTNSGVTGGFSAYVGSDLTPGRLSNGDPPPSYEEAMGHTDVRIEAGDIHTDPPPQYDEIMTACSGPGVIIGHVK